MKKDQMKYFGVKRVPVSLIRDFKSTFAAVGLTMQKGIALSMRLGIEAAQKEIKRQKGD